MGLIMSGSLSRIGEQNPLKDSLIPDGLAPFAPPRILDTPLLDSCRAIPRTPLKNLALDGECQAMRGGLARALMCTVRKQDS